MVQWSDLLMPWRLVTGQPRPQGELWAGPMTTCSRRAIAACTEAGVGWKFVPIHPPKGEQKSPAMVKINPYGKVPVWRDAEGFDMFESRAIMRHVAAGTALIPSTAKEKALMDQWIDVEQAYFAPGIPPRSDSSLSSECAS